MVKTNGNADLVFEKYLYFMECQCIFLVMPPDLLIYNGVARTLKKLRTPKGDYWIKQ